MAIKTIKEETIQIPFNDFFIATDIILLQPSESMFWVGFAQADKADPYGYYFEHTTLEEAQFNYEALKEVLTCTDHACELCNYRKLCQEMDNIPEEAIESTSEMTWED